MPKEALNPDRLPAPVGPYSNVVTSPPGTLVFVAGQVALDADGNVVGAGDIVAQTRQVMENIGAALEAAGATFADVVKIVNYITDVNEFSKMAAVRREFLREPYPTSTLVEVQALMFPELMIEIEAMAVVPQER
ncbi:MAG TPA: RidA family protein [Solirubrobacteraceae bacterium]|jgi:2-iminobutanoate/2-iminopropanoate deaminase|nr:RidA family protein [Solirubrobacteraceae bacterium]